MQPGPKRSTSKAIFGLVFLGLVLGVIVYLLVKIAQLGTSSAIIAGAITIAAALASPVVSNNLQRRREIDAALRSQRVKVYEEFMDLWFDHMFLPQLLAKITPGGNAETSADLIKRMGGFTKALILWGSDDVLRGYIRFRKVMTKQHGGRPKPLDPTLAELELFFLVLQRDLGYRNRGIAERDILALFINDLNEPPAIPDFPNAGETL